MLPHVSYSEKHCYFLLPSNALLSLVFVLGVYGLLLVSYLVLRVCMVPISEVSVIRLHVSLIDIAVVLPLLV